MVGLKNSRHLLNQSDAKLKPIVTWSHARVFPRSAPVTCICLGGNLRWTSIPSRGSSNTPSRLYATETGISSGSMGEFVGRLVPSAAFVVTTIVGNYLSFIPHGKRAFNPLLTSRRAYILQYKYTLTFNTVVVIFTFILFQLLTWR